jgi:hypothetical protein
MKGELRPNGCRLPPQVARIADGSTLMGEVDGINELRAFQLGQQ